LILPVRWTGMPPTDDDGDDDDDDDINDRRDACERSR
jgi:hypothetical protein